MSAIYTAVPSPAEDTLLELARLNAKRYVAERRCTLGRRAVAELVAAIVPASHAVFAQTVRDRDLWGFLTPATVRSSHGDTVRSAHPDVVVPTPIWPPMIELALLVGVEPARYLGNNLLILGPDLVSVAAAAISKWASTSEAAEHLEGFLRAAADREDALLLHWDYR